MTARTHCKFVVTFHLLEASDAIVALNFQLIGLKDWNSKLQLYPEGISVLRNLSLLNPNARSALELCNTHIDENELDQGWKGIVLSPERCSQ
jgi:hypothetical protein